MATPLSSALLGLKISVKTSLTTSPVKGMDAATAARARIQDYVIPTVTLSSPGHPPKSLKLMRYGAYPGGQPRSEYQKAVLVAVAGRSRVRLAPAEVSALATAVGRICQSVSSAVSAAARKKSFVARFSAATSKVQRSSSFDDLVFFLKRHPSLREQDVVDAFRTVRSESVIQKVLES